MDAPGQPMPLPPNGPEPLMPWPGTANSRTTAGRRL